MSGIDERPNVLNTDERVDIGETYMRILYFTNLDDVANAMIGDVIPQKTIVILSRPHGVNYTQEWRRVFNNLVAVGRTIRVIVIEHHQLSRHLMYQDEGRQHLLWGRDD